MAQQDIRHVRHTLPAADGHEIAVQSWAPADGASAVIQVLHGLGEHSGRYQRFAAVAAQRGYALYCHDHRGHGAGTAHRGHFADRDGWRQVVDDVNQVNGFVSDRHGEAPVALLGHSMGSFIAQDYVMRYSPALGALILSASTWPSQVSLYPGRLLAAIEILRLGARGHSALLDKLGFDSFNRRFRPARTGSDWLSRDAAEVDKYIDDPLCGGPYSSGLWRDLTGGMLAVAGNEALLAVPAALPVLITGGGDDPLGGDPGMTRLLRHYAETGHQRLAVKIYPGGRHEMLNETNRDQVMDDWLDWLDATMRSGRSR